MEKFHRWVDVDVVRSSRDEMSRSHVNNPARCNLIMKPLLQLA